MIATLLIEAVLAVFVFVRYRLTRFGQVTGVILILLASFQFAEYQVCVTPGTHSLWWSRFGFVAITLLPLAGLYLVSLVSRKPHFLKLGYIAAGGFVLYFTLVPKAITSAICGGNYVIFNTSTDLYRLYGFYYWGFLLLGIWESLEKLASLQRNAASRNILQWLIVAYLSFMAPMGMVYVFSPNSRNAVASIMCGFALFLALILALKIVPEYDRAHR